MKEKAWIAIAFGVLLVAIDQCIKFAVKLNMGLGEDIIIFDWFHIDFIENRGMAFGMELGSKIVLSLFRIIAVSFLIWYIQRKIAQKRPFGLIMILTMICAGAAGNILDCVFYGQIFTESLPHSAPAHLVPWGEGYAPILMGRVVDMFYFPLIHGTFPNWLPFWGGENFIFFSPVFNFADACITVGVALFLIFYRKELDCETTPA